MLLERKALPSNWLAQPIFLESVFLIFQITDGKEGHIPMGACTKIPSRISQQVVIFLCGPRLETSFTKIQMYS